jgi:hypothetical protein
MCIQIGEASLATLLAVAEVISAIMKSPRCFSLINKTRRDALSAPCKEHHCDAYLGVPKSFRTGRLERELQMVQLSATRCSVSPVSFAAITLCVASQRVFIVVSVYFVIDSLRKLLDTPSNVRPSGQ